MKFTRNTLGPLFLILSCPPFAIAMWYTNTALQGSLGLLWQLILQEGFFHTFYTIWSPVFFGSPTAWIIIFSFIIFEFLLTKFVKGKLYYGPITAKGNIPVYKANGLLVFLITVFSFCFASFYLQLFSASIIYDNFGAIIGALNCFSLVLCGLFYVKGRFLPSSTDSGSSGNFIFDYYWGTELYPAFLGVNLKMFINCRLGMMSWGLILLSYAAKQQALFGLTNAMIVAVALQFIYITKFFIWETGYLSSLDIMHDRAGFYICWGCLVWVPCIYTSPTMYLVMPPHSLSYWLALGIFIAGATSILINYLADRQRQVVRATAGNCNVWGKRPRIMVADYYTEKGEKKQNIILSSGWWGVSRHFHYLPEIAGAFFWSVPALFNHFAPYFYVCFLTLLLFDRAFRDDERCAQKYGSYWTTYCNLVPYKIIPFVI
ncbi:phosphatidylethanolamine N-methyltransferase family domain-containing protein [Legionella hackeliae]|uniref:7-dehydrocholesterol reductase n=1 Tax=Legionella hackeliae TaxID=449 RepID=A0A0A8UQ17_LEGHA|nr:7-dehydrocholesterol reductase [Legionella hackeliae]KTD12834.1 7-dehydrocholesterol reductase [Legionella hackeliae]CEK09137.1 7-dehydrocholesterol reductase [Legionella hackeliae]STX49047.1 7-dehydrocholesterol reductase (7-DHC reductase) (Sterol Delta(7)-reductase) (protein DWARF 5) [Legionella hackeliae]